MEDMFGHLPDAPAPGAGMFDHLPSVSPQQQMDAATAQKDSFPERLVRFSDLVMDPFNVSDEIRGGFNAAAKFVTSGGSIEQAGKAYTEASEKAKSERRVADEANNPTIGGVRIPAWQIAGGFATGGPGKAVQSAYQAAKAVRAAVGTRAAQRQAFAAAPTAAASAANPGFWATAGKSAALGGGYGAVTGFTSGEGGAENRLLGALEGGAIGGVAGPVLSNVLLPLGARAVGATRDALRYGNKAVRSAFNPQQTALENVADRMVDSGLDPAAARAAISPAPSNQLQGRINPLTQQPFNEADMAEIIARSKKGETNVAIAKDYGIKDPDTVGNYVKKYNGTNPTPMNIIDLSKEIQGEGASQPIWRLGRAANSLAGDEAKDAAQALMNRQEDQSGRVSGIIRQSVGNRDFEQTLQTGIQNLKTEAGNAYKGFRAEPDLAINELGDLMEDPTFREAMISGQRQGRVETMKRNIELGRKGQPLEPVPTVDPEAQVFSPETLDYIQRQLRIKSEGFTDPNAARHAQNLRQVFLDRIEDHYPSFKPIRERYAQMKGEFGEEGALQMGRDLTTQLGDKTDDALREFSRMTGAQKELFRLGFARKLLDMSADPQIGGAVANKFNTNAVREIVSKLYAGDQALQKQGADLIRNLRREAITTRTKNDVLVGARTAELDSDMGRMMETAKAAGNVVTGKIGAVIGNLATRMTTQLGRKGAAETLKILTETDPAQLLPLLNRLAAAAKTTAERRAYVTTARELRALNLPGVSAVVGQEAGRYRAHQ